MSLRHLVTPRLKPLSSRKSAILSVLDIGTSKVVCLIAQLQPMEGNDSLRRRTHLARVLGIGHHRSQGLKGGTIVDLEAAENAIRYAVDAAERMAKAQVQSVVVNIGGGRIGSQNCETTQQVRGRTVTDNDIQRVLNATASRNLRPNRMIHHALPIGFSLDNQNGILDPTGMVGQSLGVEMHMVSADSAPARNIMLAVERCHLGVEAVVATPYASGLSSLVDDEADMGSLVIDMGAGTTTFGVFSRGHLIHVDGVAVGGHHVTMDIARGLSTRVSAAERLKTLYGCALPSPSDARDMIAVPQVDEDERDKPGYLPKSHLVRIIQPRIEEILELINERLAKAGFGSQAGRRVILTGGACQLNGLPEAARRILQGQVRIGRPLGIKGLPEAAKGPAFSTVVGLLVYPQVAHLEYLDIRETLQPRAAVGDSYMGRIGRWLKESF